MSAVQRFEDLEVWQAARALAREVYAASNGLPFSKDLGLQDQIRRAAVSVSSNIAEGFERHTDADLKHFLTIARGSNGEARSQLHIAHDLGYIPDNLFDAILERSNQVGKMLTSWLSYLSRPHP